MQETWVLSLGLGRSLEEENGYPLQYSCLENSVDRRAWWTVVHEVAKSWTRLSDFHFASLEQMAFLCLQMWVLRWAHHHSVESSLECSHKSNLWETSLKSQMRNNLLKNRRGDNSIHRHQCQARQSRALWKRSRSKETNESQSVQLSSVQLLSRVQLGNPIDCSLPGFPV